MMLLKNINTSVIGEFINFQGEDWIELTQSEIDFYQLEQAKKAKLIFITSARNTFMYSDIQYNGSVFTNTITSGNNLTSAITIMGTAVNWLDISGNTIVLTKAQAKELAGLMMERRSSGYFQEANLINQINACTTLEEVEAINITFE